MGPLPKSYSFNLTRVLPVEIISKKCNENSNTPSYLSERKCSYGQMEFSPKTQNSESNRYNYEQQYSHLRQQQINSSKYPKSQFQIHQSQKLISQQDKVEEYIGSSRNGFQEQSRFQLLKGDTLSSAPIPDKAQSSFINPIQVKLPHAEQFYYHEPHNESFSYTLRNFINNQNAPCEEYYHNEYDGLKDRTNLSQTPSSQIPNTHYKHDCNRNIQVDTSSSMPDLQVISKPQRKVLVDKAQQTETPPKRDQAIQDSYEQLQYPSYQQKQNSNFQTQYAPQQQQRDYTPSNNIKVSQSQNIDFSPSQANRKTEYARYVYQNVPIIAYQNGKNLINCPDGKRETLSNPILPSRSVVQCSGCGEEVVASDDNVSCGIEKWHKYCFACYLCGTRLSTTNAALVNKQLLCKSCLENRNFFSELSKYAS